MVSVMFSRLSYVLAALLYFGLCGCHGVPEGAAYGTKYDVEPLEDNCRPISVTFFELGGDCDEHGDVYQCRWRGGAAMLFDFDADLITQSVILENTPTADAVWCVNRFRIVGVREAQRD